MKTHVISTSNKISEKLISICGQLKLTAVGKVESGTLIVSKMESKIIINLRKADSHPPHDESEPFPLYQSHHPFPFQGEGRKDRHALGAQVQ